MAAKQVSGGKVRVNGTKVAKPSVQVAPGDTLTFAQSRDIRVVELVACGTRRGPAPEAQSLYIDRSPPPERTSMPEPAAPKTDRKGRPTKKDRRDLDKSRSHPVE